MDRLDKAILNEIQWTFPLVPEPFAVIAQKFGIKEDELARRLASLKKTGIIRQLSAIFDTRKLGYKSALIAMSIESEKLDHVANQINKHPGVSHNYERNHEYNLWFTLAVPPGNDLKSEVDKLWTTPGGKLEKNEDRFNGLRRLIELELVWCLKRFPRIHFMELDFLLGAIMLIMVKELLFIQEHTRLI